MFFFTRVMSTITLCMLAVKYLATDFLHIFVISLSSQAFNNDGVLDAWVMDILGDHGKTHYGKIRLWTAVSWGLGAFGMSWITDYYGFNYNFIVYGGLALISLFLIMGFFPAKTPVEQALGADLPDCRAAYKAAFNLPVLAFLMEMLIMGMGVGVVEKLLFVYLKEDLGASTVLCGTSVLLTVTMELPIFYTMGWLNKVFGYNLLMMMSQFCYVIRVWGYTLLEPETKNWILLIEILHGFTFGLLWVGAKEYQRTITPMGWQGTFTSLLWMVYGSIGSGTGAIVGGYLFETIGARNTYRGFGVLVGALFTLRLAHLLGSLLCKCFKRCRHEDTGEYKLNPFYK